MKLLLKMGYQHGEGLGRKSDGIVQPIQVFAFPKSISLISSVAVTNLMHDITVPYSFEYKQTQSVRLLPL